MSSFQTFLQLGLEHITDIKGYDHILFIIALTINYNYTEWKKLLILVTAFTIGHSITLALAVLGIFVPNAKLIEFLIPVTIFITCLKNIITIDKKNRQNMNLLYVLALAFGFIHGLGFSNFLNSMLGKTNNLIYSLFAFNIGLELGQLIIVVLMLIFYFIFTSLMKVRTRDFKLIISAAVAGISLIMLLERIPL